MKKHDDVTIDERTRISLYAVAVSIPALVGGILWLTTIDAKASESKEELRGVRKILESYQNNLQSIDNRLSHIEGKLERK